MRKKLLSDRLLLCVNMVTKGSKVADIGCDHAYASIYMVENEIATSAIACDINEGPLRIATENIAKHGLTDKIETRLAPGLNAISPGEVNSVFIAGMGGMMMQGIINADKPTALEAKEWILEPQSDADVVRRTIRECGFVIDKEEMVVEEGKYYPIIHAIKDESYEKQIIAEDLLDVYDKFGKILLESKNNILKDYLSYGRNLYSNIIYGIESKDPTDEATLKRLDEMKHELQLVERASEFFV